MGSGVHIPALDGLRGLAVVAVVLYHLWPSAVPGGWLGVGLFFTLSGFLVVGLLDDENATRRVDLAHFYRRRVRRLLPAALATVVAVVVWVALTDEGLRQAVAVDGLWAVLNLANWNQMRDPGGYAAIFDQSAEPLGHMWSLAIEEQFYLLAPLAIAWTRRPVAVVAAGAVIAVAGHAIWWGSSDAYLATPVRIGEIVVGAALALALRRRPAAVAVGRLWPLALVVGLAAVLTVEETAPSVVRGFPTVIAGCWLVLVAACTQERTLYARTLSIGALRWLGLRSYAIYLIHWPLIELTDWSGPAVIAATLLLSELSFRLMEDPIRRGRRLARPVVTLVGTTAVVALALGVAASSFDRPTLLADSSEAAELPEWLVEPAPDDTVAAAERTDVGPGDAPTRAVGTGADVADGEDPAVMGETELGTEQAGTTGSEAADPVGGSPAPTPAAAPPVVSVIGDSTATQLAAGLRAYGDESRSLAVVDRSTSGCSALIDRLAAWRAYRVSYGFMGEFEFEEPCRTGIDDDAVVPDIVVVVDHGSVMADHRRSDGTWASILDADVRDDLLRIYRARIEEARSVGAVLVFTTAPPIFDDTGLFGTMADRPRLEIYNGLLRELAESEDGVELVELESIFDVEDDPPYPRSDGLHVDLDAAERLAEEVLAPALADLSA